MACLWLGTQSKGGGVALAVSAIVVFAVSGSRLRLLVPTAVVAVLGAAGGETADRAVSHGGAGVRRRGTPRRHGHARPRRHRRAASVSRTPSSTGGSAFRPRRAPGPAGSFSASCARRCSPASSASSRPSTIPCARLRTAGTSSGRSIHDASVSTHFGALGSNRYDFWRRSVGRVRAPSARGHRRVRLGECVPRPRREPRDAPSRALARARRALARPESSASSWSWGQACSCCSRSGARARTSLAATGALGTAAYFAVHTGGDWVWTIPAVGRAGIRDRGHRDVGGPDDDAVRPHRGSCAASSPVLAALARLLATVAVSPLRGAGVRRADRRGGRAESFAGPGVSIRCPSSPTLAESALADTPADIRPLRRAVAKQPRNPELRFVLGLALLDAGRTADARRELRTALALAPRERAVQGRARPSRLGCLAMAVLTTAVERDSDVFARRRQRMEELVAELRERTAAVAAGRRGEGARTPSLARQAHGARADRPPLRPRHGIPRAVRARRLGRVRRTRRRRPGSSPASASSRAASA